MKLTIDNLDGLGAVDYSAALDRSVRSEVLKIERTLNAPSLARGILCLEGTLLRVPVRRGRVELTSDAGTILFTGYLTIEPVAVYAGVASDGSVYRLAFSAVSDEWLLDKQTAGSLVGSALDSTGGKALTALLSRASTGAIVTSQVANSRAVGALDSRTDATWSKQAAAVSNASYSAYRVVNGLLNMTPAGSVVHTFSDGDGSLTVGALKTSAVRELANDVTVSGAMEPSAYWMEIFEGDGITTEFNLAGEPDAPASGHSTLLTDSFAGTSFDPQRWQVADAGANLSLSGGTNGTGLTLSGGSGIYGQTTLSAWDTVELGGTIIVELGGVSLGGGSAGTLGGFFTGSVAVGNCFAGFNVKQAGGQTEMTPMVNGVETGTTFTLVSGHNYTLRLRAHCAEMLRVNQSFYAMVDAGTGAQQVEQFGGGLAAAAATLVFEVRDEGSSSNTPATILFDGAVASAPGLVNLVAVNCVQMFGSVGYIAVKRTGSAWVRSVSGTTGTPWTRLLGSASQGADCIVSSSATGRVTFWSGRVPAAGEYVSVLYRGRRRAVARLADAASLAAEAAGGGVGTERWLGEVVSPVARCSADCESAAQAILSFSTNRGAAITGSYVVVNPANGDVWPGDVLALAVSGGLISVLVRKVEVEEEGAAPEALTYSISFANDWAEGLGVLLSEAIAVDALLPQTALELTPGASAPVLANLQQIAVVVGTSSLSVDAGLDPPLGGGFEVRRRDGGFGKGVSGTASGDLVLRTPVRGFSIPRAAVEEAFFVRMYDASVPPLYSRESSAIMTHLPIG